MNTISNFPPPPVLYSSLNVQEERDIYTEFIEKPNGTFIFYTSRKCFYYYFVKCNDQVYQIITDQDVSKIYSIRNMTYEFESI